MAQNKLERETSCGSMYHPWSLAWSMSGCRSTNGLLEEGIAGLEPALWIQFGLPSPSTFSVSPIIRCKNPRSWAFSRKHLRESCALSILFLNRNWISFCFSSSLSNSATYKATHKKKRSHWAHLIPSPLSVYWAAHVSKIASGSIFMAKRLLLDPKRHFFHNFQVDTKCWR